MIGLGPQARVFAYGAPADLRKGFDGLSALVEQELGHSVLAGDLFVFVSRNRIRAKVLVWDGSGLCLLAKRLEKGKFACLWRDREQTQVELSQAELALLLEGSQEVGRRRLVPRTYASPPPLPEPSQGSLPAGRAHPWPDGIRTR